MYATFKITNTAFFCSIFPNLTLNEEVEKKIKETYFNGFQTQKGFKVVTPYFVKKLKQVSVIVLDNKVVKDFLITDDCAELVDGIGVINFEDMPAIPSLRVQ